jgi:hypothetical protein
MPKHEYTDYLGQPLEVGDTVIFASMNSPSMALATGKIANINSNIISHDVSITATISGKLLRRDSKKVINLQGLKDVSPEFFV